VTITDSTQATDALMTAASKLGAQGWEFISATELEHPSLSERVMYFRRLKSK